MAELKTDGELVREFVELGSESAFRSLADRHLDVVFATALRGLNNPEAAREITQNVFIALARKAAWLRGETSLAAWLHRAARLEVRLWWRGELRRRRREQAAFELGTIMKDENPLLNGLAAELDEALLALRETDRHILILRYFEGRTHREIGILVDAREDAVRMRIDKALDRLTQFFRRRGYEVPAVATTVAVLGAAAHAAPVGLTTLVTTSALSATSGGAATGLNLLISKFMGLTKIQTGVICLAFAVSPAAWEWNRNRLALERAAVSHAKLAGINDQLAQSAGDLDQLRAESARLDASLADAATGQARQDAAALELAGLKARIQGLLTDSNYRWPNDLPYVRVPKSVVKSLDLLHNVPGTFTQRGALTGPALELLGVTAREQALAEQALGNYWRGVDNLMAANAYETNLPGAQPGRLTKTIVVPPLGDPMQTLAADTAAQIATALGPDREKLLFEWWDQGRVMISWPGPMYDLAKTTQTFTVQANPGSDTATPSFDDAAWHEWDHGFGGRSSGGAHGGLGLLPGGIIARFFTPWMESLGIQ